VRRFLRHILLDYWVTKLLGAHDPHFLQIVGSTNFASAIRRYRAIRQLSGAYIRGTVIDVGCGHKPYRNIIEPVAARYVGTEYPASGESRYSGGQNVDVWLHGVGLGLADVRRRLCRAGRSGGVPPGRWRRHAEVERQGTICGHRGRDHDRTQSADG
jgi:hypothetical protein